MNDIQLESNGDGTYDWGFTHEDVKNVTGVQQTISSVIHSVMLKYNELIQDCYTNKGCEAHNYVKAKQSDRSKQAISDAIIYSCTQIEGIRSASVNEIDFSNNTCELKSISVIRDDGKEIVINAI